MHRLLLVFALIAAAMWVSNSPTMAADIMRVRVYQSTKEAQGGFCQIGAGEPMEDGAAGIVVERDGKETGTLAARTFIARDANGTVTVAMPLKGGTVGNLGGDNVCIVQFNLSLTESPIYTLYIDAQAVTTVVSKYAPVAIEIGLR